MKTNEPAPIRRLARITHPDAGKCACCEADAISWYRTGVISDGRITVAARYCTDHDPDTHPGSAQRIKDITLAELARLSPQRARRAADRIQKLRAKSKQHGFVSADLNGASSLTHTHALMSGARKQEAETLERLAKLHKQNV